MKIQVIEAEDKASQEAKALSNEEATVTTPTPAAEEAATPAKAEEVEEKVEEETPLPADLPPAPEGYEYKEVSQEEIEGAEDLLEAVDKVELERNYPTPAKPALKGTAWYHRVWHVLCLIWHYSRKGMNSLARFERKEPVTFAWGFAALFLILAVTNIFWLKSQNEDLQSQVAALTAKYETVEGFNAQVEKLEQEITWIMSQYRLTGDEYYEELFLDKINALDLFAYQAHLEYPEREKPIKEYIDLYMETMASIKPKG